MQQARIRLSSTQLPSLKAVCEQIESVCQNQGIRKLGPIPLPTKRLRVPVLKAPSGQGTSTWAKFDVLEETEEPVIVYKRGDGGDAYEVYKLGTDEDNGWKVDFRKRIIEAPAAVRLK